jgi:hypothetical protein
MNYPLDRSELRNPAVVAVMLASLGGRLSTERIFTANISDHGALVLAKQRWRTDDSLVIKSLEGDLQSEARVVYSRPAGDDCYAIGLALVHPTGRWSRTGT